MKSEYNKVLMSYVCFKYFEPAQTGLVIVENRADRIKTMPVMMAVINERGYEAGG